MFYAEYQDLNEKMDKNEKNSLENLLIKKNIRWWSNNIINTSKKEENENENMHKSNFISKNLPFDFEKSWFENNETETETENLEISVLSLATPDGGGVDGAPVPITGAPDSHKKTETKKPYLSIISPEPRYIHYHRKESYSSGFCAWSFIIEYFLYLYLFGWSEVFVISNVLNDDELSND